MLNGLFVYEQSKCLQGEFVSLGDLNGLPGMPVQVLLSEIDESL